MTTLARLNVLIGADTGELSRAMSGMRGELDRVGTNLSTVGSTMTRRFTAPLIGAAAAAVKVGVDFRSGMANVASLIPGSTARVGELGDAVQELAVQTGQSTASLTDGLYNVVSAFGDTADTVSLLAINARAAAGGVASVSDAINLTSAVTKAYGDTSAEAVQQTADLALLTVRLGQTTFPELAASIGRVTPMAEALNVSQQELFGTMATFTGVTGGAAEVSTQLRGVLQALQAPTADMNTLLGQLGVSSGAALVEQRGLQGAIQAIVAEAERTGQPLQKYISSLEGQTLALAASGGQSDVFTQKLAEMANAAGATDAAFREQTEGVNASGFAWNQMTTSVSVGMQDLSDALDPAFRAVTAGITRVTEGFRNLSPEMQTTIAIAGGVVAALGPLAYVVGGLITLLAGPAGLALAITAGVVVAISGLIGWIGRVKTLWADWLEGVRQAGQIWNAASDRIDEFAAFVGRRIREMVDSVVGYFGDLKDRVLGRVGDLVQGVQNFFGGMADVLVGNSIVPDMVDLIGEEFVRLHGDMLRESGLATDGTVATFGQLAGILPPAVGQIVTDIGQEWGALRGIMEKPLSDIVNIFGAFSDEIMGMMDGIISKAGAMGGAFQAAGGGLTGSAAAFAVALGPAGIPIGVVALLADKLGVSLRPLMDETFAKMFEDMAATGKISEMVELSKTADGVFGESLRAWLDTQGITGMMDALDDVMEKAGDAQNGGFGDYFGGGSTSGLSLLWERDRVFWQETAEATKAIRDKIGGLMAGVGDAFGEGFSLTVAPIVTAIETMESSMIDGLASLADAFQDADMSGGLVTQPVAPGGGGYTPLAAMSGGGGSGGGIVLHQNFVFPSGAAATREQITAAAAEGIDRALGGRGARTLMLSGEMGVTRR